jgi:hypothetical protein
LLSRVSVSGDKISLPVPAPPVAEPMLDVFPRSKSKPEISNQPLWFASIESPFTPSSARKYLAGVTGPPEPAGLRASDDGWTPLSLLVTTL